MGKSLALGLAFALTAAACSAQTVSSSLPAATTTTSATTPAPSQGVAPTQAPTQVVTPASSGPTTYQVGDTVTIPRNGKDWARITISDVKSVASYAGTHFTDTPKNPGDVFIQANVSYEALQDGVEYSPNDWKVFAADIEVNNFILVINYPQPQLDQGTLQSGGKISGHVVYEVPATGQVRMAYTGSYSSTAVVFDVILRSV